MAESFQMEFAGRRLVFETGKLAEQANGAVLARYGDTVVLVTATMSKQPREGIDFFPLLVDYEERMYAVGRIPGGWFRAGGPPRRRRHPGRPDDRPDLASPVSRRFPERRSGGRDGPVGRPRQLPRHRRA